jgi:hypothetical protein
MLAILVEARREPDFAGYGDVATVLSEELTMEDIVGTGISLMSSGSAKGSQTPPVAAFAADHHGH